MKRWGKGLDLPPGALSLATVTTSVVPGSGVGTQQSWIERDCPDGVMARLKRWLLE